MELAEIASPEPQTRTKVEASMLRQLAERGRDLLLEYLNTFTTNSSTYIGRDAAKKLFLEYRQDPTTHNRDSDVVASALADAARRTVLLRDVDRTRNLVLILTGSPASGKTINAAGESDHEVELVHETIFTSLDRARALVQQSLTAGRVPVLQLFYTDDPCINLRRMLARAGVIGRTVPMTYMAKTYVTVPVIVNELSKEFGPRLALQVTNNSETRETAIPHNNIERALYHTQRYTKETCLEVMRAEIEKAAVRNTLTAAIYREACS